MILKIKTPRWAQPFLSPCRYKGARGGRGGGKSHFFAEMIVEEMVYNPDLSVVCIREIQKSMVFSSRRLILNKINDLGVSHLFNPVGSEIRRVGGKGVILFQGMQDHTADSIKSLEGFDRAWCEEAQSISARSLQLLNPTIRAKGSEIWFSWNTDQEDDPVDMMFMQAMGDPDYLFSHVNFADNPFPIEELEKEAARALKYNPDTYGHIWLGEYNSKPDDQVLVGKWAVDEFEPDESWDGPYLGADWGFSVDPTTLIECWIHNNILYIYDEQYGHGIEIDHTPAFFDKNKNAKDYVVRADSARPEIISYLNRNGYKLVKSVEKWKGSVEDGISKLRSFDKIVIHTSCKKTTNEARLWKYKRDRLTKDVTPKLIDAHNHCWDAIRYAIAPMIKQNSLGSLLKIATGGD